jgi:hypothetical protein
MIEYLGIILDSDKMEARLPGVQMSTFFSILKKMYWLLLVTIKYDGIIHV